MTVKDKTVEHISSALSRGETTARAVAAAEELNETLNAFLQIDRRGAVGRAEELDREAQQGASRVAAGAEEAAAASRGASALRGIPIAIKDNICVRGLQASCGSRILGDYQPPYDATVVERLKAAGVVVVGKTNCDEFAMGSSNENSAFGPVRNPWDTGRVPGGSSGGSAAAVAARIVPVALGSETGGSVRQPAALCGIVGVKPTYGRVSRYGLVAFGSSLDQVSVFGLTVRDAALVLRTIAGRDVLDSTTPPEPAVPPYRAAAHESVQGLVVGRPKEYFPNSLDPRVRERCDRALHALEGLGATVKEVSLKHTDLAIPVYYIVAPAEASSNLARFDGARYGLRVPGDGLRGMYEATRSGGFGPEVTRRILLGIYVLSAGYYDAYYRKAQQVRGLITSDFASVFNDG